MLHIKVLGVLLFICLSRLAFGQTFQFPITIEDGIVSSEILTIGMKPDAEDGEDECDEVAPPPGPSGAFDARLVTPGTDLLTDIRSSVMAPDSVEYEINYRPASGGQLVLNWDNTLILGLGTMVMKDRFTGQLFRLDMMTTNTLTVENIFIQDELIIVVRATTDDPLPVELLSFTAHAGDSQVKLEWATASELNNLGFEIYRSQSLGSGYQLIASYETNDSLLGATTSNIRHDYAYSDHTVINGERYWYKLADVSLTGERVFHSVVSATPGVENTSIRQTGNIPIDFKLLQNFPNPFNPETTLKFELLTVDDNEQPVELAIYNSLGKHVRTLFNGTLSAGVYEISWDGKDTQGIKLPSGIYLANIKSDRVSDAIKMMLVR